MFSPKSNKQKGFTLIELLVVIAVIGILSSIVIANLNQARQKSRVASSATLLNTVRTEMGDSMLLWYTFDADTSSAAVNDVSGSGNTAALVGTGAFATDTPTFTGSSFSLQSGSSIRTASPIALSGKDFTLAIWVKTTSTGRTGGMANTASADGFRFSLNDGAVYYLAGGTAGANYSEGNCGGSGLNDGTWHHIVGVFKLSANKVICYADGRQVGTVTLPGTITNLPNYVVQMGTPTCCTPFVGNIDDARVYIGSLSMAKIEQLYAEGVSRILTLHK